MRILMEIPVEIGVKKVFKDEAFGDFDEDKFLEGLQKDKGWDVVNEEGGRRVSHQRKEKAKPVYVELMDGILKKKKTINKKEGPKKQVRKDEDDKRIHADLRRVKISSPAESILPPETRAVPPLEEKLTQTSTVEKNPDFIYYPEIAKHLIDVTKNYDKKDDRQTFEETRRLALEELRKRIPDIQEQIKINKLQIYWAAKVMGGYKEKTPFGDPQIALNFLRQKLKIDLTGVDKQQEEGISQAKTGDQISEEGIPMNTSISESEEEKEMKEKQRIVFEKVGQVEDLLLVLNFVSPRNESYYTNMGWFRLRMIALDKIKTESGKLDELVDGNNFRPEAAKDLLTGIMFMTEPQKRNDDAEGWKLSKKWLENEAGLEVEKLLPALEEVYTEGSAVLATLTRITSPGEIDKYPQLQSQLERVRDFLVEGKYEDGWQKVKRQVKDAFGVNMEVYEKMRAIEKKKGQLEKQILSKETEKEKADQNENWKLRLTTDPLLVELVGLANEEKWKSKVQTWAEMDPVARETELQLYRVLVKIRSLTSRSPELQALWNKHKARLSNLGLVV